MQRANRERKILAFDETEIDEKVRLKLTALLDRRLKRRAYCLYSRRKGILVLAFKCV